VGLRVGADLLDAVGLRGAVRLQVLDGIPAEMNRDAADIDLVLDRDGTAGVGPEFRADLAAAALLAQKAACQKNLRRQGAEILARLAGLLAVGAEARRGAVLWVVPLGLSWLLAQESCLPVRPDGVLPAVPPDARLVVLLVERRRLLPVLMARRVPPGVPVAERCLVLVVAFRAQLDVALRELMRPRAAQSPPEPLPLDAALAQRVRPEECLGARASPSRRSSPLRLPLLSRRDPGNACELIRRDQHQSSSSAFSFR
jgi:hypothetical protein